MTRGIRSFLALALLLAGAGQVKADLVVNGGFETGDLTGWAQSGNTGFTGVSTSMPHSGTFAAYLGPIGSLGFLSQPLATTPGSWYHIQFSVRSDGGTPNEFLASFGGTTLFDQKNIPGVGGYVTYSFISQATLSATTLTFGFRDDPGYLRLDDVSVRAATDRGKDLAPEPGSLALLGIGATALAGYSFRRRKQARAGASG
jgi:hypothetical protein